VVEIKSELTIKNNMAVVEMRDFTLSTNIDVLSEVDPSHQIMHGLWISDNNRKLIQCNNESSRATPL